MTKARGRDVPSRTLVGPGSVGDAVTPVKEVVAGGEYAVVDKEGTAVLVDWNGGNDDMTDEIEYDTDTGMVKGTDKVGLIEDDSLGTRSTYFHSSLLGSLT